MIIVRLLEGLGNQMFQYAVGRHLSLKHNTKLKLDRNFLLSRTEDAAHTIRNYELHAYNIKEDFASEAEVKNAIQGMHRPT
jgi:hypothetical protein